MFSLAVRTLALPPSEQKNIYAPFVDITFELVDDFEKATTTGNFKEYEATLNEGRRRAINSLKQAIERLEGRDWEYDDWDIEAVLSRSAWVEVRERARDGEARRREPGWTSSSNLFSTRLTF